MNRTIRTSLYPAFCLPAVIAAMAISSLGASASTPQKSRASHHNSGVSLSTPEPHTAIEHNNRGVELGTKGLWTEAIHEHEQALEMEPSNKDFATNLSAAHLRYGDLLDSKHDLYNAMKQYRHALFVDSGNTVAEAHLDSCISRLKKDPGDLKVRQKMAEDADVAQDYETAIVEYRHCVKMSDSGQMHAQLGRCLLKAGKDVDGFAELKLAVAKTWEPKTNQELMRDLASCHRQLGDILKEYAYKARDSGRGTVGMKRLLNAGIEYRRAVTINPMDADAVRSLVEIGRECVAIRPSFDNHMMLAGAYQLAGDFEHAKMEYEECWKIDPQRPEIAKAQQSYHLAVAKSGLASPAMLANTADKVQKAVQKDPNDAMWWYILGRAKEAQFEKSGAASDKDAALEAYAKAAAINPYVSPDLSQGLHRLGSQEVQAQAPAQTTEQPASQPGQNKPAPAAAPAASADETARQILKYAPIEKKLRQGDVDGAQTDLLALVDQNAKDGRAWLLLGNTYEKKGDLDQAMVAYRQAAFLRAAGADAALEGISDSRIQPMMRDADKFLAAGDLVKAAASLREAASIAPAKVQVHKKLADVLRKMGDSTAAEREDKRASDLEKKQEKK